MIKLVQFELKKIFKSKFNLLLLILIFGTCFYMIKEQSSGYYHSARDANISLEGDNLTDIETMRYIDDFKHLHAGNADEKYLKEKQDLYNSYIESLQMDEIDDEVMKEYYGDNYLEIIEAGKNGSMSEAEIEELQQKIYDAQDKAEYQYGVNWPDIYDDEDGTFSLNLIYKNQDKSRILSMMFNPSYDMLANKKEHLINYDDIKNENYEINEYDSNYINIHLGYLQMDFASKDNLDLIDENYVNWLNHKFLSNSTYVDSEVGLETLDRMLGDSNMVFSRLLLILLMVILCADVFSIERSNHVDQQLACSQKGNRQVYVAKWITMLILSILICIGFVIMAVGYVRYLVPIRNWNLVSESQFFLFTYKELILTDIGVLLTALLATASMTGFLSCITKNRFIAAIISLCVLIFPYFTGNWPGPYKNIPSMIAYDTNLWWGEFKSIGGFMASSLILTVSLWLIISLVMFVIGYIKERRHIVR